MKTESAGSVVLLVLVLMGILTAVLLGALQEVAFLRILIGKQIIAEQSASLGQGLLSYGIVQAKKNYETLVKKQEEAELEFDLDGKVGRVNVAGTKEGVVIVSDLLQDSGIVFHASCRLTQNSAKKFIIQGFQR